MIDFKSLAKLHLPGSLSENIEGKLQEGERNTLTQKAQTLVNSLRATKSMGFESAINQISVEFRGTNINGEYINNGDKLPELDNTPIAISQQTANGFTLALFPLEQQSIKVVHDKTSSATTSMMASQQIKLNEEVLSEKLRKLFSPRNSEFLPKMTNMLRDYLDFGNCAIYVSRLEDGVQLSNISFDKLYFDHAQGAAYYRERVMSYSEDRPTLIYYTHIFPNYMGGISPFLRSATEIKPGDMGIIELVYASETEGASLDNNYLMAVYSHPEDRPPLLIAADTPPNENYGMGCAAGCLASAKLTEVFTGVEIDYLRKVLNPSYLIANNVELDSALGSLIVNQTPGAITRYSTNGDGLLLQPTQTQSPILPTTDAVLDIKMLEEMRQQRVMQIQQSYQFGIINSEPVTNETVAGASDRINRAVLAFKSKTNVILFNIIYPLLEMAFKYGVKGKTKDYHPALETINKKQQEDAEKMELQVGMQLRGSLEQLKPALSDEEYQYLLTKIML